MNPYLMPLNLHSVYKKEARRRQLQYIGKLFRGIDVEPIREALDKIENKHNQQQAMLHKIEKKVCDELVEKR